MRTLRTLSLAVGASLLLAVPVTAQTAGLRFGCTVPGHCSLMRGDFTVTP